LLAYHRRQGEVNHLLLFLSFFLSFFLWHRLHNLLVHASSERMFYLCE
jgi:hypothetical protein